jgi:hypothetical protein
VTSRRSPVARLDKAEFILASFPQLARPRRDGFERSLVPHPNFLPDQIGRRGRHGSQRHPGGRTLLHRLQSLTYWCASLVVTGVEGGRWVNSSLRTRPNQVKMAPSW